MREYVRLRFTLKQAKAIEAALANVDVRADYVDSDQPRGYLWEQEAMFRLRQALICAISGA